MKIFTWNDFLTSYTPGIAVAVAIEYAKAMASEPDSEFVKERMSVELAGDPEVEDLTSEGFARFRYGGD